ncbi:hypothetical protein I8751_24355 [Nostocaceae cyanobacterium CENA357]|uniref:Uncharacterized protein n=1 Tax=Atlanticothrix silvestris CENA357 TaxID=1725252 RepID=A0A8J7HI05_9CYAN|nr:hypothetical protein [Atlanticothrix silvestris]MBH8555419.1 hypothetical protein [Atlanticothrix silvestris CENA357]
MQLGWTQRQKPFVLPCEFPDKHNRLNIETFSQWNDPITHNLFVVVKQIGQTEQEADVAGAALLLIDRG